MYNIRTEELQPSTLYKRSDRFVVNDSGFFYKTREGDLHGPFSTESSALFDLNIFLEIIEIEKQIHNDYGLQLAWG
ncbi:DUF6316 family protein [Aliikangiella sp. IMCC44359]|uniref:DUF6316 family protein n=1 Tax=Aliikangiella sp. IMCC44359 TaxID=3459125 RepID=UPI00403B2CD8